MVMNCLIVGLGNFGLKYVNLINEHFKNINIYGLRHKIKNDTISKIKIKKIFYSYEETNEIEIDFVIITNPSNCHIDTANYFLKKNISCLIEKPLSNNYKNVLKLINNNKCCLHVGYLLRFSPLYNYLLNYKEYIGKLYLIKINVGQYLPYWRDTDYRKCVSSLSEKGGGVLLELSHDINYILGILKIKDYTIKSSSYKISDLEINVEDFSFIIMNITLMSGDNIVINICLDMIDKISNRTCKLIGSEGSMMVDFIDNTVKFNNLKDDPKIIIEEKVNLLKIQLNYFLECLQIKNFENKNLEDAILTNKIIDKIKNDNI